MIKTYKTTIKELCDDWLNEHHYSELPSKFDVKLTIDDITKVVTIKVEEA